MKEASKHNKIYFTGITLRVNLAQCIYTFQVAVKVVSLSLLLTKQHQDRLNIILKLLELDILHSLRIQNTTWHPQQLLVQEKYSIVTITLVSFRMALIQLKHLPFNTNTEFFVRLKDFVFVEEKQTFKMAKIC